MLLPKLIDQSLSFDSPPISDDSPESLLNIRGPMKRRTQIYGNPRDVFLPRDSPSQPALHSTPRDSAKIREELCTNWSKGF